MRVEGDQVPAPDPATEFQMVLARVKELGAQARDKGFGAVRGELSSILQAASSGNRELYLHAIAKASGVGLRAVEAELPSKPPAPTRELRGNGKGLTGRPLIVEPIEPWLEPVCGKDLLVALADTFRRFVVLPEHGPETLALWTLYSWAFDSFDISPRLTITAATKRSGKTRLLDVLTMVVRTPLSAANVSPAGLFRTIEAMRPTLLIDEYDTVLATSAQKMTSRSEELRGLLNCGHTRGQAVVIRAVGEGATIEARQFSTWAPICIAGIGDPPDTISDRSIMLRLLRKRSDQRVERFRMVRTRAELLPLRRQCARWAVDHAGKFVDSDPSSPEALDDRARDNWEPLLAIAEAAGDHWPSTARAAALALGVRIEDGGENLGVELLLDVRQLFGEDPPERISLKDLCSRLADLEDRPWAKFGRRGEPITTRVLASMLRPFRIEPIAFKQEGKAVKGYSLKDFVPAWVAYGSGPILVGLEDSCIPVRLLGSNHAPSSNQVTPDSATESPQSGRLPGYQEFVNDGPVTVTGKTLPRGEQGGDDEEDRYVTEERAGIEAGEMVEDRKSGPSPYLFGRRILSERARA
jgi:putative DNA primase/helicase